MKKIFGVFNVDKPAGITSRAVVNHLQRLVPHVKFGHAGTLDPLATGVLLVCAGRATRLIEFVQQQPKQYVGTFLLGRRSDTEDVEGQVTELEDPPRPSTEQLERVLPDFRGDILQRPPAYSALKVKGRRAYALARSGQEVELSPRQVTIRRLDVVRYDYPELTLHVTCGSGTYIRSLGRDVAAALGTGAVMSSLKRTAIGRFTAADACPLNQVTAESWERFLLPAARAVEHLPSITLSAPEAAEILHGRLIRRQPLSNAEHLAALDEQGRLVAVLTAAREGWLKSVRNFLPD